ncbi:MAG TPA: ATP-binding protein [Gemmatimonadaceae bacterium]
MKKSRSDGGGRSTLEAGGAVLPVSVLPVPALRLDTHDAVIESNGVLERELGLGDGSLAGRPLASFVAGGAATLASRRVEDGRRLTLPLVAAGGERWRTFEVITWGTERWLIGYPAGFDEQREALERSERTARDEARERSRVDEELRVAREELEARARALRDANDAKARFLATMSHELRTPLNAVLGYAGLLRDGVYGEVAEGQQRAVQSIVRRAKDLQLLIDDVLDLAKIEGGRAELRLDEFDPGAVLAEVKQAIAPFAREKELTVVVRTSVRAPVRLDRAKYTQVLLNLATNAVKFTPRRGEVEFTVEQHDRDTFVTRVRDTGIGIAAEDLHRIFENFQQVDSGTTRRYQGLGLGLAIVRRIVELLGGTITVDSAPGRGATFVVTLPVRPDPSPMFGDIGAAEEEARVVDGKPVVVAIDDDPEVLGLLRDSLAPAGFHVVGALTGDRGIELARTLRPLAITLDIMMPEKDGWQVLREIKADPALSDVPVIVMSIVAERSLGFALGVTDYLVKPVDRRVLVNVLERLRQRQTLHTALVLDDDEDARALLGDLLVSLGFSVRAAENADQAIAALETSPPEVMFVDLTLPSREISRVLDCVSHESRFSQVRTVIVTRSDLRLANADWVRRATTSVVYDEHGRPDVLLRQLRAALAAIGSASASDGAAAAPAGTGGERG